MTEIDQILHGIRKALSKHGRKTKVAALLQIPNAQLSQIKSADWNPSANMIRRLETAISTLFPAEAPTTKQQQD